MAFFSAVFLPLLVYVGVFFFDFTMADERACSIEHNGSLTMFNGETAGVELPCKYRLSDFTCGDYRVKVTPGSAVDKDYSHRFSPDTVWVKVVNAKTGDYVEIRTSVKRLDKFRQEKLSNPWQVKNGSVSVVDFADYDQSKAAAVLRKDEVFSVEFSRAERSVVVTCSDEEFVSMGLPEALCGDGTTTDAMKTAITALFPGQENMADDALVTYVVLNHDNVVQSPTCKDLASKFTSCQDKEQAAMECAAIFGDQAECLAGSDTLLREYYADCLTSVCDADTLALEPMNNYIKDNCDLQKDVMCSTEDWLESWCSTNDDCGVSNAKCFNGDNSCLCGLGFFYSESSRCCVETCSQPSDRFDNSVNSMYYFSVTVTSAGPLIANATFSSDIYHFQAEFLEHCFAPCVANSSCRFVVLTEIEDRHACALYSDVIFTIEGDLTEVDVFMRWCV